MMKDISKLTEAVIMIDDIKYYGVSIDGDVMMTLHVKLIFDNDVDIEKMPGKPFDENVDYSPTYTITNKEKSKWLDDNIKNSWFYNMSMIYFSNEEDAMAYKLRWI